MNQETTEAIGAWTCHCKKFGRAARFETLDIEIDGDLFKLFVPIPKEVENDKLKFEIEENQIFHIETNGYFRTDRVSVCFFDVIQYDKSKDRSIFDKNVDISTNLLTELILTFNSWYHPTFLHLR